MFSISTNKPQLPYQEGNAWCLTTKQGVQSWQCTCWAGLQTGGGPTGMKEVHAAVQTYLAKEVLQGQQGGFPCWARATAGGAHRQRLLLHDALVRGLQSQLAPA